MTPAIKHTPIPEDGRTRNPGRSRSTYIDSVVEAAKAKPGRQNAILITDSAPKSRAQAYIRRGCKAAYRHDSTRHPFPHYAEIYIYWPTEGEK